MVLQESATKISWSDSLHRQESTISHGSRRPQTMTVVLIREKRRSRQTHKVTKERRKRQKEWAASQSSSAQTFTCRQCSGVCTSRIGLYSHQRACKNWPSTMPNPHLRRTSHHHQQQQQHDYKLVNSFHNCIWHIQSVTTAWISLLVTELVGSQNTLCTSHTLIDIFHILARHQAWNWHGEVKMACCWVPWSVESQAAKWHKHRVEVQTNFQSIDEVCLA